MIHWTRQIKAVLSAQPVSDIGDTSGLLEEISFWKSRCADLDSISKQLQKPGVCHIQAILQLYTSSYIPPFCKLAKQIQVQLSIYMCVCVCVSMGVWKYVWGYMAGIEPRGNGLNKNILWLLMIYMRLLNGFSSPLANEAVSHASFAIMSWPGFSFQREMEHVCQLYISA